MDIEQLDSIENMKMQYTVKKVIQSLKERCNDDQRFTDYLNEYDEYGAALIHYIAAIDQADLVGFLSEMGADLNMKVKGSNYSALVIAAAKGYDRTVKALMKSGADIL